MNIITVPYNSRFFYLRPDTSLNRDSYDYFCPEYIKELAVTHFTYIRIDKAGKRIKAEFAKRYYSSGGYGLFLSATRIEENFNENDCNSTRFLQNPVGYSLDNTTYYTPAQIISEIPERFKEEITKNDFDNLLERITKYISVRSGDMLAIETNIGEKYKIEDFPHGIDIKYREIEFKIIL